MRFRPTSPASLRNHPTSGDTVNLGTLLSVRIVWGEGGFPIRTIVGRGYKRPVGNFPSVKSGRTLPFDAMLQRDFMHICEADSSVVDFCSEPHRLEMTTSLHDLVYFPDCAVLEVYGGIRIVEIKKSLQEVDRDPFYAAKIDFAKLVYERLGWSFEVLETADILEGAKLANARPICMNHTTRVTTAHRMTMLEAIRDRGGSICFGEAVAALGYDDNPECSQGTAIVHAMIVRRFVEIDIGKPITMFSPLRIAIPSDLTLAEATARQTHSRSTL